MSLEPTPIRIKIELTKREGPCNVHTGGQPKIVKGATQTLELGLFNADAVISIANISLVTFTLRPLRKDRRGPDLNADPLILVTASGGELDDTLDAATWADDSKAHVTKELSDSETNVAAGLHWMSLRATTSDSKSVELISGYCDVISSGYSGADSPPSLSELYYTKTEVDALLDALTVGSDAPAVKLAKTAGVALGGHRAVVADDDAKMIYADKDTADHAGAVVGITTNAASLDASVTVQTEGEVTEPSWSWTVRGLVYLANSGQLSQTPPTTGFIQIIGTATDTNTLNINIQQPIELV